MNDDDLLEPLKGLQRAEPNPFLFTRIEARLNARADDQIAPRVSPATVRLVLAGVVLLGVLNALVWWQAPEPAHSESATEPTAYRLETANYQLY